MKKTIIGGLTALLVTLSSYQQAEARKKTKIEKPSQVQTAVQQEPPFSGSHQEYVTLQSGDRYIFFCWSKVPEINDAETFAIMKSGHQQEGYQCLDHFYFKEGDNYCSFERSRRKDEAVVSILDNLNLYALDEAYAFDFAPPVKEVYALFCTATAENIDLPYSTPRKDYVFKDSAGRVCVFMGMPEEENKLDKIGKSKNKNKKK